MISYPLGLDDFWFKLRPERYTFQLDELQETSATAGGEVVTANHGDELWGGRVTVGMSGAQTHDSFLAAFDLARMSGGSLLVTDPARAHPQADPDGTGLAGASPVVAGGVDDRRVLRVSGLPDGYTLSAGDHLSIRYGSDRGRYYLGRVVQGDVADGSGQADLMVLPFLPSGIAPGDAVDLIRPACRAVYLPKSLQPVERLPGYDSGFSFEWRQTRR